MVEQEEGEEDLVVIFDYLMACSVAMLSFEKQEQQQQQELLSQLFHVSCK